jgi:cytochrome b involved in lipid metabolism
MGAQASTQTQATAVPPISSATATPSDASTPTYFTSEQISLHNTQSDCWVIIHGVVYDLSQFADHPGGTDVL